MGCYICNCLVTDYETIGNYVLERCTNNKCGHIQVQNVPSDDVLAAIYDSDMSHLSNSGSWTLLEDYKQFPDRVIRNYWANRTRDLEKWGLLQGQPKICEVGCSTGVFMEILSTYSSNVSGVEVGESQLAEVRRRGFECKNTIKDYSVDDPFDLILMYAVVEHMRDPVTELKQAYDRLSAGGAIVIDVPNWDSFYRKVARRKWLWLIPPIHIQYFNRRSISQLLSNAGFKDVSVRTLTRSSRLYLVVFHSF